jgi:hypothetical protein
MTDQSLPVVQQHTPVTHSIESLERMAAAFAKSQLFGVKSPEQAFVLMLVAQSEGQHPATIAQDYDIIQGRPARKTHSVLARFQQAGGTVEWHALTEKIADATFSHRSGGSCRMTWTIDMAQKAGLTNKDNWKHYPRAMLRARCIAEGVRSVFPGAIGGMIVAEEAQDIEPRDITPAKVVEMPTAKPVVQAIAAPVQKSEPAAQSAEPPASESPADPAEAPTESGEITSENALKPGQVRMILAKMAHAGLTEIDFKAKFGKPLCGEDEFPNFRASEVNDLLAWINSKAG